MLRRIFFLGNVFFWTIFIGILAVALGPFESRGRFVGWLARVYSKILLLVSGVPYRVIGLERIDRNSHYIFASNHESSFDIPLIFGGLPYHIVSLAKKEIKKIPILGWAMAVGRHVFIDRYDHRKAMESLEDVKASLASNPRSLILFPEGTRSPDGEIHQFKKGGLGLAVELGMDVVPLAVCGTRDVLAKKSLSLQKGEVELRVGDPIPASDWTERPKREFADHVRGKVVAMKSRWREGAHLSKAKAVPV